MSNPVFFTEAGQLDGMAIGARFALSGAEARHAITVKRMTVGEPVDVVDGAGVRLRGTVASTEGGVLEVECAQLLHETPPAPRLVLVQALAKGDRDELAIETATELGVDAIIPWQSERAIVRWKGERGEKALAKWRSGVGAAAKQARRSVIPEVRNVVESAGLLTAIRSASLAIVLHEEATEPLREVLKSAVPEADGEVLFIVGPEGGITPREVQNMLDAGAKLALLGHHVLRSSTAGPAAIVSASEFYSRW
ncbi:16S rRNA (uracil(1498)-N(3))-methyltransferase [Pseudarthrobacter sp. J1738]|uniref:16S rRNA (uracil(1498)-N(3))-methyltransferase n=1 Tax=unclassified Pseudarthrobacter TaxID=2647000 RepID=UPI003D2AF3FE